MSILRHMSSIHIPLIHSKYIQQWGQLWLTQTESCTYQWAVLCVRDPISLGSTSRTAPGSWALHTIPPPALMLGKSSTLAGPGHRKKRMGSPSTVMKRTGEMTCDLPWFSRLDCIVVSFIQKEKAVSLWVKSVCISYNQSVITSIPLRVLMTYYNSHLNQKCHLVKHV